MNPWERKGGDSLGCHAFCRLLIQGHIFQSDCPLSGVAEQETTQASALGTPKPRIKTSDVRGSKGQEGILAQGSQPFREHRSPRSDPTAPLDRGGPPAVGHRPGVSSAGSMPSVTDPSPSSQDLCRRTTSSRVWSSVLLSPWGLEWRGATRSWALRTRYRLGESKSKGLATVSASLWGSGHCSAAGLEGDKCSREWKGEAV